MGCSSSKDAVQEITVEDGVVKPASGKSRKVKVQSSGKTMNDVNQKAKSNITTTKTTSAKSRDSGIDEMDQMDDLPEGIITNESDPHLITEAGGIHWLSTPNLSPVGHQLTGASTTGERMKSRAILEELESQGLISGTKVQKGGAAFEVSASGSAVVLEPLRPPARLERLKKQEKPALTKEEIELKQRRAELRREKSMHKPNRRSRLASQLAKDQEMASNINPDIDSADVNPEDGSTFIFEEDIIDPFKSRHELPHE